ncbi:uncharacterized protein FSUBG_8815 [Fusarium subglutinans]|uniref:Uncharacterized protein n=1 Tax=Gibberella subglutinans TaxID=42677 RepID=A0A8H5PH36_GIBSU|nr:uncharacterized protein FSUBG_8815 [Fusarium subglutinans]KAF5596667.1 hypothetical protein FSUBG_8815 [Fusarium subglutinans]
MHSQLTLMVSWFCLFLTAFSLPTPEATSCLCEVSLPTITVRPRQGGYENVYTRTYQDIISQHLTTVIYTLTRTCSTIDCPVAFKTAPPAGFTQAVVADGTITATLTFPTQSLAAYSAAGYVVMPINTATPDQSDSASDRQSSSGTPAGSDASSTKNGYPGYNGSASRYQSRPGTPDNSDATSTEDGSDEGSDSSHNSTPSSSSTAFTPSYSSASDTENTPNPSTKQSSTSVNLPSNDNSESVDQNIITTSSAGFIKPNPMALVTMPIAGIIMLVLF